MGVVFFWDGIRVELGLHKRVVVLLPRWLWFMCCGCGLIQKWSEGYRNMVMLCSLGRCGSCEVSVVSFHVELRFA